MQHMSTVCGGSGNRKGRSLKENGQSEGGTPAVYGQEELKFGNPKRSRPRRKSSSE